MCKRQNLCLLQIRKIDYYGSSRTKRRRIKAKVAEHLQILEDLRVKNKVSSNLECVAEINSQIPNEELDSQTQAAYIESVQESDSEMFYSDSSEELHLDGSTEGTNPCNDLKRKLADWAPNHNISHSALSELLHILVQSGLGLPRDPRTLLSTITTCEVKEIGHGSYYHFGVSNAIILQLSRESDPSTDTLILRVNIDGLPLFRSSKLSYGLFWPRSKNSQGLMLLSLVCMQAKQSLILLRIT